MGDGGRSDGTVMRREGEGDIGWKADGSRIQFMVEACTSAWRLDQGSR